MSTDKSIHLLQRHEINTLLWDKVIGNSADGRVYATTSFLDSMAPGWQALITYDYNAIMPLPVRQKFGINYIFQPAFCQQLGVITRRTKLDQETADAFLRKVQKHFKYAEINGHSGQTSALYPYKVRKNYLLSLQPSYHELRKQFSRSAKRNIHKAIEAHITINKIPDATKLIELHSQRYKHKLATAADFKAIQKVFDDAIKGGTGHFFYAIDSGGNTISSSGYLQYKDRLIFLMNGNLREGLDAGAAHLLQNHVIETFAGTDLWIDFEGSDEPSFARFYEQYGATDCDNYPFFVFNHLPIPFHWMKPRVP